MNENWEYLNSFILFDLCRCIELPKYATSVATLVESGSTPLRLETETPVVGHFEHLHRTRLKVTWTGLIHELENWLRKFMYEYDFRQPSFLLLLCVTQPPTNHTDQHSSHEKEMPTVQFEHT